MKLHLYFLEKTPKLTSRVDVKQDQFALKCNEFGMQLPNHIEKIPHIEKYFKLMTDHFKTREKRIFFTLKLIVKCIGNKEVISTTRNRLAHGAMPGGLQRNRPANSTEPMVTRADYIKKMRGNSHSLYTRKKGGVYDERDSIHSLYPMFVNAMNCSEFAVAANLVCVYFFTLLQFYEEVILKEKSSLTCYSTLCHLDGGDHAFNLIQLVDDKTFKCYKLYVDSFYRAVRTQKEFDSYLSRSKSAFKLKEKFFRIASTIKKDLNNNLAAEFVKSESKLSEDDTFTNLDNNSFMFTLKALEYMNFSDMIEKIHKEYYHYFHHEKEIPKNSIINWMNLS